MPESLIVKFPKPAEGELTTTRNVEIALDIDGIKHKLTRVRRVAIVADSDEMLLEVELTMWSPMFDDEIVISRHMAEAIRNRQTSQGLAFLTPDDRKAFRDMRAAFGFPRWAPVLDKLIAEFDRDESELADIVF